MNENIKKDIDNIVWWIPFKSVRDKIRNIYYDINSRINSLDNTMNSRIGALDNAIWNHICTNKSTYILNNMNLTVEEKKLFLEMQLSKHFGYQLNLDNPKTMSEKIHWTILYYKNPLITVCCDKYLFPKYIESKLGKGYTIHQLGAWDDPKDIDFSKLPNQFVLKSNIGSGSLEIMIVKDKSKLNEFDTKNKLYEWIQPWSGRLNRVLFEEHLKNMKRKIIAEEYIKEIEEEETEYCYYSSFSNILFIYVAHDRTFHINNRCIYYDENWNKINLNKVGFDNIESIKKPKRFEEMKTIAKELSKDFPLVRVDFYNLKDKLLVGELTFYPNAGLTKYEPIEWDYKFGEMIDLNKIPKEHLAQEWIDILNKDQTRPDQTRPDQTRPDQK